jgi:hypothetical protein
MNTIENMVVNNCAFSLELNRNTSIERTVLVVDSRRRESGCIECFSIEYRAKLKAVLVERENRRGLSPLHLYLNTFD